MSRTAERDDGLTAALARVDRLFGSDVRALEMVGRDPDVLAAVQIGALRHPDPHIRRSCLWALDHYANDASMPVFAAALADDVHFVRDIALHSLACESCKCAAAVPSDVVAPLVRVLAEDPKADLRIKALTALLPFMGRDRRARDAVASAARANSDAVVRRCAADAVHGMFTPPKKRYDRKQRHHASMGHCTVVPPR